MTDTNPQVTPRRNIQEKLGQLFPAYGATCTIESLVAIFGSKAEVRRIIGQYSSPAQTRNWMNFVFVPGEHPMYRYEEPTEAQKVEAAYWVAQTQPAGRPVVVKAPKNLVVFERLPDGNFRPVEVEPEIAVKLKEFADAKRAAEKVAA